ncbi:GtrA family protein [Roseicitreum antarcticum]|uniref:Putative flippase GtrA (Transmembrane translocase of bactoprenol-linked glucose) n=1 Tax=Roseicitreum antarcticum TaxID=564137 RepID=A0A1H2UKA4_9RHOB|nr:GtrA family protein [Roseicitreum antarcticum]SDW56616.1 Putative flippase GtrA (transmembrane translocase of bactoprenol-linked glucose) [Roseicitreum antarcticum]
MQARQFGRYIVAGGLAACVDLGGFVVLTSAGMALLPAAVLSFALAMLVNFALSSAYVFGAKATWRRLAGFAAFATLGLCLNTGLTLSAATMLGLAPWLAKTCGIGGAFVFNYAVNALVVFRRDDPGRDTRGG